MKIALKTLGCKVNQSESDLFLTSLRQTTWELVAFRESADIYVINSCAVTGEAERKTGQYLRRALRTNPKARVLLTGCMARKRMNTPSPGFDERIEVLTSFRKVDELLDRIGVDTAQACLPAACPLVQRSRVWLKIQDGCDHFCTYCIVPHLRGPVTSLSTEEILRSVRSLEDEGYREIVLCGINLGYYGRDTANHRLIDLLERLVKGTSQVRFRLSSLEPFAVTDRFVDRYFDLGDRACPHFHIPLQSGSNWILNRMNRGYTTHQYQSIVETIRSRNPLTAITTDLMVGFPGETEELFRETVDFFTTMQFARTHLFVFSPRPGTAAYDMNQKQGVEPKEQKRREHVLREQAGMSQVTYQSLFLGKKVPALVESVQNGIATGRTDTYLQVEFPATRNKLMGNIVWVSVQAIEKGVISGSMDPP